MSEHAQTEIRDCSRQMFDLIKPIVPIACQAFVDYRLNAITLTGPEAQAFRTGCTDHLTKGEKREYEEKKKCLSSHLDSTT